MAFTFAASRPWRQELTQQMRLELLVTNHLSPLPQVRRVPRGDAETAGRFAIQ